jgi:hypothetical protein
MNYQIFATFSIVLLALGRPECSSSNDTRSAWKRECHSNRCPA